jgi:hypothetical protein
MLNNTTLGDLIKALEAMDAESTVMDGFGSPHSDRGNYSELAFSPLHTAKVGDMLAHARSAVGAVFTGWKGGEFQMDIETPVYIGEYGDCGDPITPTHFKYWALTATLPEPPKED